MIFPGLINAHDHLELNHYPRSKFREVYKNAHQWGEDMNARLDTTPYRELRAHPIADRCFIGGLKNLLCGATTVVHHGPPHRCLFRRNFPVRVMKQYGWSHSLHFNTDEEVQASHRSTPTGWPWFIHLAEGTDKTAALEYRKLKALGCVSKKTVIVHGVGMSVADIEDARLNARGLVWCPTTNLFLLGQTAEISAWGQSLMLGSDSRLTADGDWMDELRGAVAAGKIDEASVFGLFTASARALNIARTGTLNPGAWADWWVWGGDTTRAHIQLVVRGGVPQIGSPEMMAKFPHVSTVAATLDGAPKAVNIDLARQIARCSLKEPGLELLENPQRRLALFWSGQRFRA